MRLKQSACSAAARVTMRCQWGGNPQNWPSPLGFPHPAGGGQSHGHRQHAQKIRYRSCLWFRKYPGGQTDRQTDRSAHHNTSHRRSNKHHHHHNRFTALLFRDHPGEPVPEENFWTLWCKGRLTEADTPTIWLGAIPSVLTSAPHLHHPPK